jgi:Helicase conserved C-terminal domain
LFFGNTAQEEREFAIRSFKGYKKDVLVATDVASKGLDFAEIQHVINFDMPKEIEDYGKWMLLHLSGGERGKLDNVMTETTVYMGLCTHLTHFLFSPSHWKNRS